MQQDTPTYHHGAVFRVILFIIAACLAVAGLVLLALTIRDGYRAYTREMPSWDVAWAAWQVMAPIIAIVAVGLFVAAWFVCRVANRTTTAKTHKSV